MNATEDRQIMSALELLVEQTPDPGPTPIDSLLCDNKRSSNWVRPIAIAAATAAIVGGGFIVMQSDSGTNIAMDTTEQPIPVQQPAQPTAFPVLDDLPAGLSATAFVDRVGDGRTGPRTQALIGRRVDGVLTDAIALAVQAEPLTIAPTQGRTPVDTVILGQPATVYDDSYSSTTLLTVTWGSGPHFFAQGKDPLALLDHANPDAIEATITADTTQPPLVTFGALPDDFEVIVKPQAIVDNAAMSATLSIGADNYEVTVSTINPLIGMAMTSDGRPLRSIDINSQPGWTTDSQTSTADIVWQVDETTYASLRVGDRITAADALAIARKITFVDFDSWTARYSPVDN